MLELVRRWGGSHKPRPKHGSLALSAAASWRHHASVGVGWGHRWERRAADEDVTHKEYRQRRLGDSYTGRWSWRPIVVFLLCGPACRDESLFSAEVSLLLTDYTVGGRLTKRRGCFLLLSSTISHLYWVGLSVSPSATGWWRKADTKERYRVSPETAKKEKKIFKFRRWLDIVKQKLPVSSPDQQIATELHRLSSCCKSYWKETI